MGETCGMKLVMDTHVQPTKCKWCEKAETKLRKREGEVQRVARWQQEGKNPASVEKAMQTIAQLDREIQGIYDEINKRRSNIGGQRPQAPAYDYSQSQYGAQYQASYAQAQY